MASREANERFIIGRPVDGNHAFILDANEDEVAGEESGELYIGEASVARGYLHRPQLTDERFRVHPTLGRIYRTGDRVRRNQQGELVYLGRVDLQVKLRGRGTEVAPQSVIMKHEMLSAGRRYLGGPTRPVARRDLPTQPA